MTDLCSQRLFLGLAADVPFPPLRSASGIMRATPKRVHRLFWDGALAVATSTLGCGGVQLRPRTAPYRPACPPSLRPKPSGSQFIPPSSRRGCEAVRPARVEAVLLKGADLKAEL